LQVVVSVYIVDAMKMLVSAIQFCPSTPLINELECISFLALFFGPSMDRVVAAFTTKQRLLRGARTRDEDNFILATLINCAQTARCLLGILQRTVQMTDLCWERRNEEKNASQLPQQVDAMRRDAACPIFSQDHQ
jgi:hypothetical protein